MTLDEKDRLLLRNQYLILSRIVPAEKEYYEKLVKIVESGYEAEYSELTYSFSKPFSKADSTFVLDVLTMFAAFVWAKEKHVEMPASHCEVFEFHGFDGNNEPDFMNYAEFLISRENRWVEFKGKNLNSHTPTLKDYRLLLAAWRKSENINELTKDDLVRIAAAVRA